MLLALGPSIGCGRIGFDGLVTPEDAAIADAALEDADAITTLDASLDAAPMLDASVDAMLDASVDASVDAMPDAMLDAGFGGALGSQNVLMHTASRSPAAIEHVATSPGFVAIAGTFDGTIDLGDGPHEALDGSAVFVALYATEGALAWAKVLSADGGQTVDSLSFDPLGNLVIGGVVYGAIDFGAGTVDPIGAYDRYAVAFDPAGTLVGARRLGGGGFDDGGGHVAAGSFACGSFQGTATLGGASLSASDSDLYFAGYDEMLGHRWSRAIPALGTQQALVAAASPTALVAIGTSTSDLDLGGGLVGAGTFVLGLDLAGLHRWSHVLAQPAPTVRAATLGPDDVLLVVGLAQPDTDFGSGPLGSSSPTGFVARFDASGAHLDARAIGSDVRGVATDMQGNVFITGTFDTELDGTASAGASDIFVASFTSDGARRWTRTYGSAGADVGHDIAVTDDGQIFVAVTFEAAIDFGDGEIDTSTTRMALLRLLD